MAKKYTPKDDDEKIVKDNIQKRFKNMFSGKGQPLTNMSIQEVEALKSRLAELETRLSEQQVVPPPDKPSTPTQELAAHFSSDGQGGKPLAQLQETDISLKLDRLIGLWVTAISAAVGLAFFGVAVYIVVALQSGMMELSDKVLMPYTAFMFVANLVAFRLAWRNRTGLGVWISYLVNVIVGPVTAVLVMQSFYIIMGGYLVMFALLFIALILPKTTRLRAILVAVAAVLVMTGIEALHPAFRLSTSHIQNFTLMVLGPAALAIIILFAIIHQLRYPRIQTRLTALLIVVMVPLLVIISIFVTSLARERMEAGANTELQGTSRGLASTISTWLELNTSALKELALQPDILSMNAEEQRPVLQAMAKSHPYMYLVGTTDLQGMNVARSDNNDLTDYSDRAWFQDARNDAPFIYQSLISRTTQQPALVISTPIKTTSGRIIGVAMFAAELTDIAKETQVSELGENGYTYLVDAANQTLAHPDPAYTTELRDMSKYPPVIALRQGKTGLFTFSDENGVRWRASISLLDNGWAVIAQRPEDEILAPARQFQTVVILLIMAGGAIMLALAWFTTRRTLQPVATLTDTISAIAAGDLNRTVEVNSRDEIGTLARTFNFMTTQIRTLVGTLEQRVLDRTHDLELASEVGRTVTEKVMDPAGMLIDAAEMIRTRFGLYYTQIYLTDPDEERIVLRAGTGEVGKELLARGHFLPINANSLNGRAVVEKQAQIVPDTKENPNFLPNPLLPNTRSEMSIPLIVGGKVVGVLDMQSEQPGALSESNLPAFEALAGQLAIAIQNAALFAEVKDAHSEAEAQIRRFTTQGWQDFLNAIREGQKIGFAFDESNIIRLKPEVLLSEPGTENLRLPITMTGTKIGEIRLPADPKHSLAGDELELVQTVAAQLAQHVENLRLLGQAEQYREEAEQAVRRLTHEGWDNFMQTHSQLGQGYTFNLTEVKPLSEKNHDPSDYALKHPMAVGEEVIGELAVNVPQQASEAAEILAAVSQQLSSHIENLRLSELNEKNAQREQTLRQITSSLRSSNNPTVIMRTAVRELGSIMGRRAVVQLVSPQQADQANPAGNDKNEADTPAHQS